MSKNQGQQEWELVFLGDLCVCELLASLVSLLEFDTMHQTSGLGDGKHLMTGERKGLCISEGREGCQEKR